MEQQIETMEQIGETEELRLMQILTELKDELNEREEKEMPSEAKLREAALLRLNDETQQAEAIYQKPFSIRISADLFYPFIKAPQAVAEEAIIKIEKDGMRITTISQDSIAMVNSFIPARYIEQFQHSNNQIGINIKNLIKITKLPKKNAVINLSPDAGKLRLRITSQPKKRMMLQEATQYELPILPLGSQQAKEPDVPYTAMAVMQAAQLIAIIKDARQISSYLTLTFSQQELKAQAKGDIGEYENLTLRENMKSYNLEGKSAQACYNLEYLDKFMASCPKDVLMKIKLASNEPIKLSYEQGAEISYLLAPYMSD